MEFPGHQIGRWTCAGFLDGGKRSQGSSNSLGCGIWGWAWEHGPCLEISFHHGRKRQGNCFPPSQNCPMFKKNNVTTWVTIAIKKKTKYNYMKLITMLAVSRNSTFCTRKKTLQKNSHMLKLLYPLHRHTLTDTYCPTITPHSPFFILKETMKWKKWIPLFNKVIRLHSFPRLIGLIMTKVLHSLSSAPRLPPDCIIYYIQIWSSLCLSQLWLHS